MARFAPEIVMAAAAYVYWRLLQVALRALSRRRGWAALRLWVPLAMAALGLATALVSELSYFLIGGPWDRTAQNALLVLMLANFPVLALDFLLGWYPPDQVNSRMALLEAGCAFWALWYGIVWMAERRAAGEVKLSIRS